MHIKLKARISKKLHTPAVRFGRGRIDEAPVDGAAYVQQNGGWVSIDTGNSTARWPGTALLVCVPYVIASAAGAWVQTSSMGGAA